VIRRQSPPTASFSPIDIPSISYFIPLLLNAKVPSNSHWGLSLFSPFNSCIAAPMTKACTRDLENPQGIIEPSRQAADSHARPNASATPQARCALSPRRNVASKPLAPTVRADRHASTPHYHSVLGITSASSPSFCISTLEWRFRGGNR
jgi:hypothetical protein